MGVLALHLTGCVILTLAQQLQSARREATKMAERYRCGLIEAAAAIDCMLRLIYTGAVSINKQQIGISYNFDVEISELYSSRAKIVGILDIIECEYITENLDSLPDLYFCDDDAKNFYDERPRVREKKSRFSAHRIGDCDHPFFAELIARAIVAQLVLGAEIAMEKRIKAMMRATHAANRRR